MCNGSAAFRRGGPAAAPGAQEAPSGGRGRLRSRYRVGAGDRIQGTGAHSAFLLGRWKLENERHPPALLGHRKTQHETLNPPPPRQSRLQRRVRPAHSLSPAAVSRSCSRTPETVRSTCATLPERGVGARAGGSSIERLGLRGARMVERRLSALRRRCQAGRRTSGERWPGRLPPPRPPPYVYSSTVRPLPRRMTATTSTMTTSAATTPTMIHVVVDELLLLSAATFGFRFR